MEKMLKNRRSIRKYTDVVPDEAAIRKIIEAGIWAPSGLNNQPWKFKIIKDKVAREGLASFTKYARIIRNAPAAICVFLDNRVVYNRDKDLMAIGACIQNMLLTAYDLGLGTCWLGEILNKKDEVREYLKLESCYELAAVITLGYSDETPQSSRKPLEDFMLN